MSRTACKLLAILVLTTICSCQKEAAETPATDNRQIQPSEPGKPLRDRTLSNRLQTTFTTLPLNLARVPTIREIAVPEFPGGYAIWGATGRDDSGNIWFGVSSNSDEHPSAHLIRFNPSTDEITDMGDVVSQLQAAYLHRDGESQMKIHSKIVQADDGYIYFASLDEAGERADPLTYPTWGGHLWRIAPDSAEWEHLLATKEALIAVDTSGKYVYALGYFNHVLYQYDSETGMTRSVTIGSIGAHISRNFLTDLNGHAYVPRVVQEAGKPPQAYLVELDEQLKELQAVPLSKYLADKTFDRHGIVGFARFKDGTIAFCSHSGFLWLIEPREGQPANIRELGWLHPSGGSYASSIYSLDGEQYLCGVVRSKNKTIGFEWFIRDMKENQTTLFHFAGNAAELLKRNKLLLYGTNTRDEKGNAYVVGRYQSRNGKRPVLLQVAIPKGDE